MDMACHTRLILWFSHHLSNFQYSWPLDDWAFVKDLPKCAPHRVFVQVVLEREIRLSYWDKVKQILRNAINKMYNRISDLRKEIQSLEKNVALAEEGVRRTNSEYEAAEAKLEAMDGELVQAEGPGRMKRLKAYAGRAKGDAISVLESLEAKEVLLARALEENKALFISLYKNFGNVLMKRLPTVSSDGKLRNLRPSRVDSMAIDLEEPPTMVVDEQTVNRANERVTNAYNAGEQVQWCLSTLGYVKDFSRQYATESLPGAFPSIVAGALRSLFDRIADMDMECRTRLIFWFSHHLSNFQYFWPWDDWAFVKDLPKWAPQRVFVHGVLEREIRL